LVTGVQTCALPISAGIAIGECWLYDEEGPIGTSTVAALAQRKPMTNVPPP